MWGWESRKWKRRRWQLLWGRGHVFLVHLFYFAWNKGTAAPPPAHNSAIPDGSLFCIVVVYQFRDLTKIALITLSFWQNIQLNQTYTFDSRPRKPSTWMLPGVVIWLSRRSLDWEKDCLVENTGQRWENRILYLSRLNRRKLLHKQLNISVSNKEYRKLTGAPRYGFLPNSLKRCFRLLYLECF